MDVLRPRIAGERPPEDARTPMAAIHIFPDLEKALREACKALGGHELGRLLDGMEDGMLILDDGAIEVIRDYVRRIEDYLHEKYPGYTGDEDSDPMDEDLFLEDADTYRNKLVYMVAGAVGDDFLEGCR